MKGFYKVHVYLFICAAKLVASNIWLKFKMHLFINCLKRTHSTQIGMQTNHFRFDALKGIISNNKISRP